MEFNLENLLDISVLLPTVENWIPIRQEKIEDVFLSKR